MTARLVALIALFPLFLSAQPKYWIYLKDKNPGDRPAISETTLQHRLRQGLPAHDETDLPVQAAYEQQLQQQTVRIINRSKWLNAVSAILSPEQALAVSRLPFVTEVVPMNSGFYIARTQPVEKAQLAPVMAQVQSEAFLQAGYTGKGVTIGVIDAGFYGADSALALRSIFSGKRVLGIRDYVKPNQPASLLYSTAESYSDVHGTEVMAAIGGMDQNDNIQYGMAMDARFYLARTDYSLREWRGEEDNWIAAMEWMDSLGVRLINTSLGYARGFSDPRENYQPSQMDGKTSAISRAAQLAADKKGLLIIVSAGNEGEDKNWRIISTPADAKGVLSIGATNQRLWNKIGYSSTGPEFLPYLKPNVSCFSLYGTSLSAPVITGFAACLMQAHPELTNKELFDLIEKSAHLYPFGNNYVGYGVPTASRALALAKAPYLPGRGKSVKAEGKSIDVPVQTQETVVVVYRKKNKKDVLAQQVARVQNGVISLKRQSGEHYTTIDLKDQAIEVEWE
jgi:subtilisin family serine protease